MYKYNLFDFGIQSLVIFSVYMSQHIQLLHDLVYLVTGLEEQDCLSSEY